MTTNLRRDASHHFNLPLRCGFSDNWSFGIDFCYSTAANPVGTNQHAGGDDVGVRIILVMH